MIAKKLVVAFTAAILMGLAGFEARAEEGATGFYLLGSKGAMAGFVPPPGVYVQSDHYFYSGNASANVQLPLGADLAAGVHADAIYGINTGLWVTPEKVLDGNLALGISVVSGWKDIKAAALVGPFTASLKDDEVAFGDPVMSAMLGWHQSNWHSNLYTLVNVPLGQWESGRLANIGFNRWAVDTGAAVTYLDQTLGHEVSIASGITYNFENPDTNYKSGTEFHVEFALIQHLSKQFAIGVAGYHYQQITGDSGAGAHLGAFEGRVTALGPLISYAFNFGQIPVNTSLRYYREFNVANRLEGDAGLLTVAFSLAVAGH
jgi:hypothetical protein